MQCSDRTYTILSTVTIRANFFNSWHWHRSKSCTLPPVHTTSDIICIPAPPAPLSFPNSYTTRKLKPSNGRTAWTPFAFIKSHIFSTAMTRTTSQAPGTDNMSTQSRCQRCERKFRTSKDLALHILSKHGHVYIPQPEDTRSVTLSSPLIASSDNAELDQLLQVAEQNRVSTPKRKRHHLSKQRVTPGVTKRVWTYTSSSSKGSSSSSASSSASKAPLHLLAFDGRRAMWGNQEDVSSREGESTGPRAKDVYVARCRAGRIPLVPIQAPSPATLNFANGLF